jgi:hypothetical protein
MAKRGEGEEGACSTQGRGTDDAVSAAGAKKTHQNRRDSSISSVDGGEEEVTLQLATRNAPGARTEARR